MRPKKIDRTIAMIHAVFAAHAEAEAQNYARLVTSIFNDHLKDFLKKLTPKKEISHGFYQRDK